MKEGEYSDKIITAERAAALVQPGSTVFLGSACAAPRTILAALEASPSSR